MKSEIYRGYADYYFAESYGVVLTDEAYKMVDKWEKQYGSHEVSTAFGIAVEQYDDPVTAFMKIGGILYNRKLANEKYFMSIEQERGDETSV